MESKGVRVAVRVDIFRPESESESLKFVDSAALATGILVSTFVNIDITGWFEGSY